MAKFKGSRRVARPVGVKLGKAHLVGPAAPGRDPASILDAQDRERAAEEDQRWSTMRDVVVNMGKRLGILTTKTAPGPEPAAPARSSVRKKKGEREAPSGGLAEQDSESVRFSFVDEILEPPYPFEVLSTMYENSSALRQNVDAMATNIDGFGHRFESVIDFSHPNVAAQVKDLLLAQALDKGGKALDQLDEETLEALDATDEEIETKLRLWKRVAAIEKHRLRAFFQFLNPLESFTEIRKKTRESLELLGNAGWEVLREKPEEPTSRINQVYNVPFVNVRLIKADTEATPMEMIVRRDDVTYEKVTVYRYFRRFVRLSLTTRIYYKEFGDPRVVSRSTGKYFTDLAALRAEEGARALPANEFIHWQIPSQLTPYGIPRWIGSLLSVLGSRAAEEVNFMYFDNKAIPPMVVLVSGGRLSESSVEKFRDYVQNHAKGREKFHDILVLEAVPASADVSEGDVEASGKMRIEIKPLTGDQTQDGLFQEYDKNNVTKIGRSFRQPQILTGDSRDMNRSTADTARALAEEQVYQPARDAFDEVMNRYFVPNQGSRFWTFRTNASITRTPNDLIENAVKVLREGAITPNECRRIIEDAFDVELAQRPEGWAHLPPKLAALEAGASAEAGGTPPEDGEDLELDANGDGVEIVVDELPGDALARGKTAEAEGHAHPFVAVRSEDGRHLRVVASPGEDGHVHPPAVVDYLEDKAHDLTLSPAEGDGGNHVHKVSVPAPVKPKPKKKRPAKALGRRARVAQGALRALSGLRAMVQDEIAAKTDEFFDPAKWADED